MRCGGRSGGGFEGNGGMVGGGLMYSMDRPETVGVIATHDCGLLMPSHTPPSNQLSEYEFQKARTNVIPSLTAGDEAAERPRPPSASRERSKAYC